MLLRPEHRTNLKHPFIYPHHGLFIKLGALGQKRLFPKVIQLKDIGPPSAPAATILGLWISVNSFS